MSDGREWLAYALVAGIVLVVLFVLVVFGFVLPFIMRRAMSPGKKSDKG